MRLIRFPERRARISATIALVALVLACSTPAPATGAGTRSFEMKAGGATRSYQVFTPSSYDGRTPRPLVVALHGGLGTGEIMAEQSGFNRVAEKHGFVVVYPDGIRRTWNAGRCCGPAMERKLDDVGFIRALIDQVAKDHAIDRKRVYGIGFSNGAMLLHRIACEAPGTFTAIAPISGGIMIDSCPAKTGVATLLIQGRQDERIPWNGGVFDGTYRPSIAEIVSSLASRNGCGSQTRVTEQRGPLRCEKREGCTQALEWCGVDGVGHQWPGGKTLLPRLLGGNTQSYDASAAIGAFFAAQTGR